MFFKQNTTQQLSSRDKTFPCGLAGYAPSREPLGMIAMGRSDHQTACQLCPYLPIAVI